MVNQETLRQVSLDRVRELRAGWDGNDKTPFCGTKQGCCRNGSDPNSTTVFFRAPCRLRPNNSKGKSRWEEL